MKLDRPLRPPRAYFITFSCYGVCLPGNEAGWVRRSLNQRGTPFAPASARLAAFCTRLMKGPKYQLDQERRVIVLNAILEICEKRDWLARAVHVRDAHVHIVVEAEPEPDLVLNALKAKASFRLNRSGLDKGPIRRWARKGSKIRLWTDEEVECAIHYVLFEQGEPMEVYSLRVP